MTDIDTVNKILKQNNLKRDTYKLVANQDVLKDLGIKYGNILNRSSLIKILGTLKENHGVPERTSLSLLTHYLQNVLKLFSKIELYSEKKGEKVTRYISTYVKFPLMKLPYPYSQIPFYLIIVPFTSMI
jgi:hypothetical protein